MTTGKFRHEEIFRGAEAMKKLHAAELHICGAGALGSNLAMNLARIGVGGLTIIDMDRVEEHNIGTQIYSLEDVGGKKADLLRNILFREVGIEITAHAQELNDKNIGKLLRNAKLVVDTFDNSKSRTLVTQYCKTNNIACLHAGVNDGYGEVIWNHRYAVPSDVGLDACDYPLSRHLIMLVVAVAGECLIRYITTGSTENYSLTIGDLSINPE